MKLLSFHYHTFSLHCNPVIMMPNENLLSRCYLNEKMLLKNVYFSPYPSLFRMFVFHFTCFTLSDEKLRLFLGRSALTLDVNTSWRSDSERSRKNIVNAWIQLQKLEGLKRLKVVIIVATAPATRKYTLIKRFIRDSWVQKLDLSFFF